MCLLVLSAPLVGCSVGESMPDVSASTCSDAYKKEVPQYLSNTCLYSSISDFKVSRELQTFTPNYPLWSDGADKKRWIYFPPNTQIDTTDPDRWIFPLGTQFFKEFRRKTRDNNGVERWVKLETRHLMKIRPGKGLDSWSVKSYAWRKGQQDAVLTDGEKNVLGTTHDIPTEEECVFCHKGNVDGILGFEAIQLSDQQAKNAFGYGSEGSDKDLSLKSLSNRKLLSSPVKKATLPGTALEQKVLGYLHSNCGNCHNPLGHAADNEADHLVFRHKLEFQTVEQTDVYRTAVNQPTQNFTITPYIVMGAKYEEMALYLSALFVRMNSVDEDYRMPMVAREVVDYPALELMHQWMLTLPTPQEYDFGFDKKSSTQLGLKKIPGKPSKVKKAYVPPDTTTSGLHLHIDFDEVKNIPPVMIVYWPEDKGLSAKPIMDHKDGYFDNKLIVGNQGSIMQLKNSDDVGHTIYVKDKRRKIHWQLSYMPPGSSFEQALFWEDDVFVELRCRLHLYMSAWAGSISSRYYTIIHFDEDEIMKDVIISDFPQEFSEVKIWAPRMDLIDTKILAGESLEKKLGSSGSITLTRVP